MARTPPPLRTAALALAAGLLAAACHNAARVGADFRAYEDTWGFQDIASDEVLDIQVFRDANTIRMTNTSAIDFGPSTVWVNARFSDTLDAFAPGQTVEMKLSNFRDQFGTRFRGGGFFAADEPDQLALVQIEDPSRARADGTPWRWGLIVLGGEER